MSQQIITSDKSFLKLYGKKPTMEQEGFHKDQSVKTCSHCGKGQQRQFGRFWTPCPICSKASPYRKKIIRAVDG